MSGAHDKPARGPQAAPAHVRHGRLARRGRKALALLLVMGVIALASAMALARPGGGQSFGGGSTGGSSSGGGGGGGDGNDCFAIIQLVFFLIELNIESPEIGIPVDIALVGGLFYYGYSLKKKEEEKDWATGATAASQKARGKSPAVRKALAAAVTQADPEFSLVLFEDFVYALFTAVHDARGKRRAALLAPYLAERLVARLDSGPLGEVRSIAIGALRYTGLGTEADRVAVTLEFEANYSQIGHMGSAQAYYVVERWTLSRSRTARSRKPESASVIGCPSCGAPLEKILESKCSFCSKVVQPGEFDWRVDEIAEIEKTERPPQLTGDTPERGTGLPTVTDPDCGVRFQAIARKDPSFTWQVLSSRVGVIFAELQVAWSTLEWDRARPFVSDEQFQMLSYWIETYRRAGMRNVTENARITNLQIASVISDRYYDAVTVRVYATGLDYTVTNDGKVVSGSRTVNRPYSEYWTLIRGTGTKTRPGSGKECPNCGAPLAINMAGNCTSCRVKVTSGEFDWVLSRIEQDEAYG